MRLLFQKLMSAPSSGSEASILFAGRPGGPFYRVAFAPRFFYVALAALAIFIVLGTALTYDYASAKRGAAVAAESKKRMNIMALERKSVEETVEELEAKSQNLKGLLEDIERKSRDLQKEAGLGQDVPKKKSRAPELKEGGEAESSLIERVEKLTAAYDALEREAGEGEQAFNRTALRLKKWRRSIDSIPSAAPLDGAVKMSGFGYRYHPITGFYRMHEGVDLHAIYGDPVYSSAAGKVVFAKRFMGYGNLVKINHGNGYETWYAHLSRILVKAGDRVEKRQLLGKVGQTGSATGAHLHYEVRYKGKSLNPSKFINLSRAEVEKLLVR